MQKFWWPKGEMEKRVDAAFFVLFFVLKFASVLIFTLCPSLPKGCADGWRGATESSTAGPQCCNTVAPPDTQIGRPCVFPFKYKDVEYNACTYVESEWLWCATEVDEDGDMVPNRYNIYICNFLKSKYD